MGETLKELLSSKKFVTALLSLVIVILGHFGIDLDLTSMMAIISPLLAFILGQGIADAGKEAVKIDKTDS